jgi:hypothetical protein
MLQRSGPSVSCRAPRPPQPQALRLHAFAAQQRPDEHRSLASSTIASRRRRAPLETTRVSSNREKRFVSWRSGAALSPLRRPTAVRETTTVPGGLPMAGARSHRGESFARTPTVEGAAHPSPRARPCERRDCAAPSVRARRPRWGQQRSCRVTHPPRPPARRLRVRRRGGDLRPSGPCLAGRQAAHACKPPKSRPEGAGASLLKSTSPAQA